MLWTMPHALEGNALIAWIAVALFIFYTAFDLYTLPHAALGAELSRDPHQRTRLFAVRQMSFTVGMLLAFGAIQVAMNAEDPRSTTAALAIPAALVAVVLLAIPPLVLREPGVEGERGGRGLLPALRDVVSTRPARLLLFVFFIESAGVGAVGTMAPYIAQYLLERPDVVGLLPACLRDLGGRLDPGLGAPLEELRQARHLAGVDGARGGRLRRACGSSARATWR